MKTFSKKESLKPNLMVFSGDLVFGDISESKIKDQYEIAKDFLVKICNCFASNYGDIPMLIVPGNHDIDRNVITDGEKLLRGELTEDSVYNLMNQNEITWKRIIERQKEWFTFVNSIPNQPWEWNSELHMATGIIEHQGRKIGIAGLNSSWASHEQKEKGLLWIGRYQYDSAHNAIRDADFKIVVAHHPMDCLHSDDKRSIGQKIETQFHIFLHGHEHLQWFSHLEKHLKCMAGACYNGIKKQNGFSWLVIDNELKDIKIYLREYTDQGKGGWRANHIPEKTDDKGFSQISLHKRPVQAEKTTSVLPLKPTKTEVIVGKFPDNLEDFIRILVD